MEEILASIRKIISEDSNEPQSAVAAVPPQAEADVLELTQEIEEVPQPAPAPVQAAVPPPAPEPVRAAPPPQDEEVVFQTISQPPQPAPAAAAPAAPVAAAAAPAHSTEGLVSDKARGAIDDALSALDFGGPEPHDSKAPVAPVDGLSVEAVFDRAIRETFEPVLRAWLQENAGMIVDRMKPAIREWMDEHLPEMMKVAVEAEVQRAVRARSTKR